MWCLTLCILYSIVTCGISETTKKPPVGSIQYLMQRNQISPDVVSVPPKRILLVKYHTVRFLIGIHIKASTTTKKPSVHWRHANPKTFYTLCLVDPDCPNRRNPINGEWLHWLTVNIPGNRVDLGETLVEYMGPMPFFNTGFHRYVMLVYKQPSMLDFSQEPRWNMTNVIEQRRKFSIAKFTLKYNMGHPVAGNFFRGEYDPKLNISKYLENWQELL